MFAILALCLTTLAEAKDLGIAALTANTPVPEHGVVNTLSSVEINAAPAFVHPYVASLKRWPEWTVWSAAGDPTAVWEYSGTDGAVGSDMKWTGKKFGSGRTAITTVGADNGGITYDLWFGKMKDPSKGRITITPTATGSHVEWQDMMSWGFPASLFMPGKKMSAMMSTEFSTGLAKLKLMAETDGTKAAAEEAARKAAEEAAQAAAAAEAAKQAQIAADAAKAAEEAAKAAEEAAKKKKKGHK